MNALFSKRDLYPEIQTLMEVKKLSGRIKFKESDFAIITRKNGNMVLSCFGLSMAVEYQLREFTSTDLHKNFSIAVPIAPIYKMLRLCAAGDNFFFRFPMNSATDFGLAEISIDLEKRQEGIDVGKTRIVMDATDPDDEDLSIIINKYEMEKPTDLFSMTPAQFKYMLEATIPTSCIDISRPIIEGIYVDVTKKSQVIFRSANGFSLTEIIYSGSPPKKSEEVLVNVQNAVNTPFLIPIRTAKTILRILERWIRKNRDSLDRYVIQFSFDDKWEASISQIQIQFGEDLTVAIAVDQANNYPSFKKIIPKNSEIAFNSIVKTESLSRALKSLNAFSRVGDEFHKTYIDLTPNGIRLVPKQPLAWGHIGAKRGSSFIPGFSNVNDPDEAPLITVNGKLMMNCIQGFTSRSIFVGLEEEYGSPVLFRFIPDSKAKKPYHHISVLMPMYMEKENRERPDEYRSTYHPEK